MNNFYKFHLSKKLLLEILIIVFSIILSIVLCVLSFSLLKPSYNDELFKFDRNKIILLILFLIITIASNGWKIIYQAFKNLFHLKINEKLLITIAIIAAFILGEYFEAAMVVSLYSLGEWIESFCNEKSQQNINSLTKNEYNKANLLVNNVIKVITVKQLKIGDIILIKTGEKIPVDCQIIKGNSSIDLSILTGESMPISVGPESKLCGGSINISNEIICKVLQPYSNSTQEQYARYINESILKENRTQKFVNVFANYYVPVIILIALLVIIIPLCVNIQIWQTWLNAGLSILLASCPCAFVISIPIAYVSTIGNLSHSSVLLKNTELLDKLAHCQAVVFDKTGTLTTGKLKIDKIVVLDKKYSKQMIIDIASSIESHSNHLISNAFSSLKYKQLKLNSCKEIPGLGLEAKINDQIYYLGSEKFIKEHRIKITNHSSTTSVYLASNKFVLGAFILKDEVKKDARNLINNLRKINIKNFYILSGDNQLAVDNLAKQLPYIKKAYGNLLPSDKVKKLCEIKKINKNVVFIGDGINDAQVMKASDIGIALNKEESLVNLNADVIIHNDSNELQLIYNLFCKAKKNWNTIIFNTSFVLSIKLLVIIAIIVLSQLSLLGSYLLLIGVLADVGLTILSSFTSFLLFKKKTLFFNKNKNAN